MSDKLGTSQFQDEVMKLIDRFAQESDITCAEVIGTLEVCKANFLDGMPPKKQTDEVSNLDD